MDRTFDPSDCTAADVDALDAWLVKWKLREVRRLPLLLLIHSTQGAETIRTLLGGTWTTGINRLGLITAIDSAFSKMRPWRLDTLNLNAVEH